MSSYSNIVTVDASLKEITTLLDLCGVQVQPRSAPKRPKFTYWRWPNPGDAFRRWHPLIAANAGFNYLELHLCQGVCGAVVGITKGRLSVYGLGDPSEEVESGIRLYKLDLQPNGYNYTEHPSILGIIPGFMERYPEADPSDFDLFFHYWEYEYLGIPLNE